MKRVFRSIINIRKAGKPTIEPTDLRKNYRAFIASKIDPEDQTHIVIYEWIEAYFREYNSVPAIELLLERAQKEGNEATFSSLEEIAKEIPYTGSDFLSILKEKGDEQKKSSFQSLLTRTWQVVNSGLKIGKKKDIKGLLPAIEYFTSEARKFRTGFSSVRTEADIRTPEIGQEVLDNYMLRKKDPSSSIGMLTYLQKIDDAYRGLKPGELMMIAGFVAQGKTTIAANFTYNGIIQGYNGMLVPMEMNYEEMTDFLYTLHTSNPEWLRYPKFKNLVCKISYEKVCYGELSDLEEDFFKESTKDFCENESYGKLLIYQPEEKLTPSHLEMKMYEFNARLKEEFGERLDFVVVDYVGLMVPDKNEKYGDFNTDLNNIIKRLKNIAMTFDVGAKIRMITPFQVNRTGWVEAQKNDGVYKLSALSNANEAERTSDLIISSYFTEEMKRSGIVKLSCLKQRKGQGFPPFEARLDFVTKHLRDFIEKAPDDDNLISELPLDT